MTGLSVAVVLQLSLVASVGEYAEARKDLVETGRPMVVLLGTDWCPGCVKMKRSVTPEVARRGGFRDVQFVRLDTEQHPRLARAMMAGSSIPQLVMYRKTSEGWKRSRLVGAQQAEVVQQFIKRGLKDAVTSPVARRDEETTTN